MADPGDLDQRVTFQSPSGATDAGGGRATGWTDIAANPTVWANIEALTGREGVEADKLEASARYRVTIRNRSDVDSSMRLVWLTNGNLALNIREMPDPGPRALYREFFAEEGVAV